MQLGRGLYISAVVACSMAVVEVAMDVAPWILVTTIVGALAWLLLVTLAILVATRRRE